MTNVTPENWYVYQPRGTDERKRYGDRLWGVGGPYDGTTIVGLTKREAYLVSDNLNALKLMGDLKINANQ